MKITTLAGGVGGAKLVQGLSRILDESKLTVIVNTADDFELYGLYISPDIDTIIYTLANIANPSTGWGIKDDTFYVMRSIEKLGGQTWFKLGDRDLATHLLRTQMLKNGETLTTATRRITKLQGIQHSVLPMTDDSVKTYVKINEEGYIPFQEYFVKKRFSPTIGGLIFEGIETAKPTQGVIDALLRCDAIVFCPSNPFVSIDPILSLPEMRDLVKEKPVLAISPIIGGKAIKGPLAKMFLEMGIKPSALAVANHYQGLVKYLFIDNTDEDFDASKSHSGIITQRTNIFLPDLRSRIQLAKEVIDFLEIKIDK